MVLGKLIEIEWETLSGKYEKWQESAKVEGMEESNGEDATG